MNSHSSLLPRPGGGGAKRSEGRGGVHRPIALAPGLLHILPRPLSNRIRPLLPQILLLILLAALRALAGLWQPAEIKVTVQAPTPIARLQRSTPPRVQHMLHHQRPRGNGPHANRQSPLSEQLSLIHI